MDFSLSGDTSPGSFLTVILVSTSASNKSFRIENLPLPDLELEFERSTCAENVPPPEFVLEFE